MATFWMDNIGLVIVLMIWVLPWKGYALWIAAQKRHKGWFIALLLLNTLAILDIYYIFYVTKKDAKDVKRVAKNILSGEK